MLMMPGLGLFVAKRLPADAHNAGPAAVLPRKGCRLMLMLRCPWPAALLMMLGLRPSPGEGAAAAAWLV